MNAEVNSSLNGGSGGLAGVSQKISVGAGGLHAPAYSQECLRKKLLLAVIVLAAVNLAAVEGDRNI